MTVAGKSAGGEVRCQHVAAFGTGNPLAERNTLRVVVLTTVMMVVEIIGGMLFNSMALLADGWHMGSHALALGISAFAYVFARRHAHDGRFAFGTWKVEILGGYTSAILLAGVAVLMAWESAMRLMRPVAIQFDAAILVAAVGLAVNLVCAWMLGGAHKHEHHHETHPNPHHSEDLNLRSAYLHVIADASTSVLAIAALLGGKYWGASWLDPVMGMAGSVLVGVWSYGLLRDTSRVLLDAEMNSPVVQEIRDVIAASPWQATINDLHVWRVSGGAYACIVSIATSHAVSAEEVRRALAIHEELRHISVEITPNTKLP